MERVMMGRFRLTFLLMLVVLGLSFDSVAASTQPQEKGITASQEQIKELREARKKLAHRRRRIIINDDGNLMVYDLKEATRQAYFAAYAGLEGTQVDTIFYCTWCSGFGVFTYNTKVGEVLTCTNGVLANNKTADFIKQGTDALQLNIDFCRANNIEIFWSMRMNDTHDVMDVNQDLSFSKLKKEHPQWLIGSKENKPKIGGWTAVDYTHPEIRDLAYRFFEEVCENYDIDGVEMDFLRDLTCFKRHAMGSDATQDECDMMTELIRRIREMTERVGLKRGKPILISVRVPDSVGYCKAAGLDIVRWMADGLIDMLVAAGYYQLNPWEVSVRLGHRYGVSVYPCLSESRIKGGESEKVRQSMDCYRGRAMNVWNSGADGVYLFNYGNPKSCLWNQIGEPAILEKLDKVYCIAPLDAGKANGWVNHGWSRFLNRPWWSPFNPLPLREGQVETFYLDVGEDIGKNMTAGLVPDIKLRLNVKNIPGAEKLTVVFNDQELVNNPSLTKAITLSGDINADEWFEYNVEPAVVVKGANRIKLTLWECGAKNPTLADVLLWVRYRGR
jgi:hypothetical protein